MGLFSKKRASKGTTEGLNLSENEIDRLTTYCRTCRKPINDKKLLRQLVKGVNVKCPHCHKTNNAQEFLETLPLLMQFTREQAGMNIVPLLCPRCSTSSLSELGGMFYLCLRCGYQFSSWEATNRFIKR